MQVWDTFHMILPSKKPFRHQLAGAEFCNSRPYSMLAFDPGTGIARDRLPLDLDFAFQVTD